MLWDLIDLQTRALVSTKLLHGQLNGKVDVVVASPGRLMEHKKQGNVYFSHVTHVVIDEVDTMLTQGFGPDIRAILRSVIAKDTVNTTTVDPGVAAKELKIKMQPGEALKVAATAAPLSTPVVPSTSGYAAAARDAPRKPAQLVMATATLTKAVRALLTDVQGGFNLEYTGTADGRVIALCCITLSLFITLKRFLVVRFVRCPDPSNLTPRLPQASDHRVKLSIVEVDGVHR